MIGSRPRLDIARDLLARAYALEAAGDPMSDATAALLRDAAIVINADTILLSLLAADTKLTIRDSGREALRYALG